MSWGLGVNIVEDRKAKGDDSWRKKLTFLIDLLHVFVLVHLSRAIHVSLHGYKNSSLVIQV